MESGLYGAVITGMVGMLPHGQDCGCGVCRDGAEEWSENSGTLRNNATLVDLGVANQALQHEDIEVTLRRTVHQS